MILRMQLAIAGVLALLIATAGLTGAQASSGAADHLAFGQQTCTADGKVNAELSWTPSHQGAQWVDISLHNDDFTTDYSAGGPFGPALNAVIFTGLAQDTTYYVRVNTATPSGWQPSPTVKLTTGPASSRAMTGRLRSWSRRRSKALRSAYTRRCRYGTASRSSRACPAAAPASTRTR